MRVALTLIALALIACDAPNAAHGPRAEQQVPIVSIPPLDEHGDGLGTAFAVSTDGWWLTSRHVASACAVVALIAPNEPSLRIERIEVHETADLALLRTRELSAPSRLIMARQALAPGQAGAAIGFPRGAFAALELTLSGPVSFAFADEDIPDGRGEAWTASDQRPWNGGSGGPIVDQTGRVLGVVAAQSNDRRMMYAVPRDIVVSFLRDNNVSAAGGRPDLSGDRAARYAELVNDGLVRRVACLAETPTQRPD